MFQSHHFQYSYLQYSNNLDPEYPEILLEAPINHSEFFPPFVANVDQFVHDNMNMEFPFDESFPLLDLEELKIIWREEIEDENGCLNREQTSSSFEKYSDGNESCSSLNLCPSIISFSGHDASFMEKQPPLIMPEEGKEVDNQLGLNHLAMAYAEAVEMKQAELADVILKRICEKVSVVCEIKERIFYYAFSQYSDKQTDYLKQESVLNFDRAFQAFYQIFPYGMIPHFTANSAILEARPLDAEILHVVDFDIGEGAQWSSMIMAISQQKQQCYNNYGYLPPQEMTLKITAIKWREEDYVYVPWWRNFEETKRRLEDFAESLGVMLDVEEIELQDLVREVKIMRKRGGREEWLAFNCMWALPHMGRRRSGRHVMEFLGVAKELLADSGCESDTNNSRGIITFSNGSGEGLLNKYIINGFGSFFDSYLKHYQSLLESIEWNFPVRLAEARLSMECLFVAPYVDCHTIVQTWEELKDVINIDMKTGFGFEGLSLGIKSLTEAKEMVSAGETPFGIRIDGENNDNEMVLEWKEIPLLKVSAWRL